MGIGLLIVAGIFGLSILSVHAIYYFYRNQLAEVHPDIVIIMTYNNENEIEKEMNHIYTRALCRGREVKIVIFDGGSRDTTLTIVEKWNQRRGCVQVFHTNTGLDAFLKQHRDHIVQVITLHEKGKPLHLSALYP
ncbi:glycosyltransferase [Paenibacillus senegalensis]|uniref:glycosyltransferase n=1 Tax=Paenibacillus senegalensis TaxID=1465766 RepID=UPI000288599E|nr:glycosyltransferase [Paenibacillus senegalensis]